MKFSLRKDLKSKLSTLVESSSFIGVPNVYRTDSWLIRLVWVASLLGSLAYSSYTIVLMVIDYLNYSTLVSIVVTDDYKMDFPSVTICNLNSVDFSNLTVQQAFKDFIKEMWPEPDADFRSNVRASV